MKLKLVLRGVYNEEIDIKPEDLETFLDQLRDETPFVFVDLNDGKDKALINKRDIIKITWREE